jgi:uncharacterized protein
VLLEFGPINMVIGGWRGGEPMQNELEEAANTAVRCLDDLSPVLNLARIPYSKFSVKQKEIDPTSMPEVLQYMCGAVDAAGDPSLTPMAAVAGSIADLTAEALGRLGATRAFVNNGGDIALIMSPEEHIRLGIVSCLADGKVSHILSLSGRDGVGGIATSGLGGRSLTKGVADAVVALAKNARLADTAATVIANETLVEFPGVVQVKAETIDAQTDLEGQMVTERVENLPSTMVEKALDNGRESAQRMIEKGIIHGAFIFVQGRMTVVPKRLLEIIQ